MTPNPRSPSALVFPAGRICPLLKAYRSRVQRNRQCRRGALAANQSMVNKPLNDFECMSSSADDFVSYFSRALQGQFFQNQQTLNQFRQVLSMGDAIWRMPMPLGVSAFVVSYTHLT